jgi:hypothetical protein
MAGSKVFGGRAAKLSITATSSAATAFIGALKNWELTATLGEIEATNFDSSGHYEMIDGIDAWEIRADALVLSTAGTNYAQQASLRSALSGHTRKYFQVQNSTAAGSQTYKGFGYVTSWKQGGNVTDVQLHNFVIKGDGKYTEA